MPGGARGALTTTPVEGRRTPPRLGIDEIERLAATHAPSLLRYARTLVGDEAAAEDLVQDTFERALAKRDLFRAEADARTWLHRIMHNLAVDHARRQRPSTPLEAVEEVEMRWRDERYTVDVDAVIERAERRDELLDALVRLPFIYRTAVVLHDVEGFTAAEVARLNSIRLPAAKQRIRRGRMMLVTALAHGAERRRAVRGVPLRCWDARRLVSEYVDGALPASRRGLLERHLETCPTCPPLYAALVGVRSHLGALRDPDAVVPPRLAARITRAVGIAYRSGVGGPR